MTATVRGVIARFTAARSPSVTLEKPETLGSNRVSHAALPEAAIVARVRPWKPWSMVMISCAPSRYRAPHFRASLIAPSLASAPLLQKKTWARPDASASRVASCAISAL